MTTPLCTIADGVGKLSAKLSLGFVKIKKIDVPVASVTFEGLKLHLDTVDALLRRRSGYTAMFLYDELGAPRFPGTYAPPPLGLRVQGRISGNQEEADNTLVLVDAILSDLEIDWVELVAIVSGKLTWRIRGDEAESVAAVVGKVSLFNWQVFDALVVEAEEDESRERDRKRFEENRQGSLLDIAPGETAIATAMKAAQEPTDNSDPPRDTSVLVDELMGEAFTFITLEAGPVSVSLLQKFLKIGYNRAARLLEDLETIGRIERDTDRPGAFRLRVTPPAPATSAAKAGAESLQ